MEGNSKAPSSSWSQLQEKLLHQIPARLDLPDCERFGSVCRPWHAVCNLYRPPPLLVSLDNATLILSCIFDGKHKNLLPKLKLPFEGRQIRFSGSDGWIAIVDRNYNPQCIYLANPISRKLIYLPPVFQGYVYVSAMSSSPASGDRTVVSAGRRVCPDGMQVDFLVLCKSGDTKWAIFDEGLGVTSDMAFHNGKLYVLSINGDIKVYALDDPHPRMIGSVTSVAQLFDVSARPTFRLGKSGGELLLVAQGRSGGNLKFRQDRRHKAETRQFRVFKLEGENWVRIKTLGDRALLVSYYGMDSLCAREIIGSEFRGDCIYKISTHGNLSVYSMKDRKCLNLQHFSGSTTCWLGAGQQ